MKKINPYIFLIKGVRYTILEQAQPKLIKKSDSADILETATKKRNNQKCLKDGTIN